MKYLKWLCIFLATCACFIGCTHQDSKNKGKTVFKYNESAGITSLDPAFAKDLAMIWASSQLYNGLVQLTKDLSVIPCIAHSWEISEDGLTYIFHLRNDVYFHEHPVFAGKTRRVVASDFVYSFRRITDESVASPGAWVFNDVASHDGKSAFFAPDDSTFIIKIGHPFSPFLGLLTMPYCSVVAKEIVEHFGADFRKNPIGTGPFYMKLWKEGVKLVLLRNPRYFEKDSNGVSLPYLDAVAISFIIDKQTVFLEFVKGNLDFMNGLDPSYKDELLTQNGKLRIKYNNKINMITQPYLNTEYLGFLQDSSPESIKDNPLQNKKLRQAINYAFDRKKMIRYLRNNIGTPGRYGMIPAGLPGFDTSKIKGYDYNPEKAAQLLNEAGFPNGRGLPPLTLSTTSSYLDLCKYIQQQLGLIGLQVKVDVNPPAALREQIAQSKSAWFRGSWIADYPDAENYLSLFYSKNFCPAGPNYTHYKNPAFDKLYELARKETSDSLRILYYQQMDNLIMEEAPVMVLYYDQILRFTQKRIEGIEGNSMNSLDLRRVRKK